MSVMTIALGLGLFAFVVGVAYWFAVQEQKTIKSEAVELDERTRQARREAAGSIANIPMP